MSIVLLKKEHVTTQFDCGVPVLNAFLEKYALQSQTSDMVRTYVLSNTHNVVFGYYSLVYGSVAHLHVPERVQRGTGRYPIPLGIIARLAIDQKFRGKGFGEALLKDALWQCARAGHIAGLRSVMVTAKDKKVKNFYEKYSFVSSSLNESDLFLLMKDVRKMRNEHHTLPESTALSA